MNSSPVRSSRRRSIWLARVTVVKWLPRMHVRTGGAKRNPASKLGCSVPPAPASARPSAAASRPPLHCGWLNVLRLQSSATSKHSALPHTVSDPAVWAPLVGWSGALLEWTGCGGGRRSRFVCAESDVNRDSGPPGRALRVCCSPPRQFLAPSDRRPIDRCTPRRVRVASQESKQCRLGPLPATR